MAARSARGRRRDRTCVCAPHRDRPRRTPLHPPPTTLAARKTRIDDAPASPRCRASAIRRSEATTTSDDPRWARVRGGGVAREGDLGQERKRRIAEGCAERAASGHAPIGGGTRMCGGRARRADRARRLRSPRGRHRHRAHFPKIAVAARALRFRGGIFVSDERRNTAHDTQTSIDRRARFDSWPDVFVVSRAVARPE